MSSEASGMKKTLDRLEEFTALAVEAKRRGLTYGKLVAATTEAEREKMMGKGRRAEEGVKRRKREKAR